MELHHVVTSGNDFWFIKDNLRAAKTWWRNLPPLHVIIKYQQKKQMKWAFYFPAALEHNDISIFCIHEKEKGVFFCLEVVQVRRKVFSYL